MYATKSPVSLLIPMLFLVAVAAVMSLSLLGAASAYDWDSPERNGTLTEDEEQELEEGVEWAKETFTQVRVEWDHYETPERLHDAQVIYDRYRLRLCDGVQVYYQGAGGQFLVLCKVPDSIKWGGIFVPIGPSYKNYIGDPTTLLWQDIHIRSMHFRTWPKWAEVIAKGNFEAFGEDTLLGHALRQAGFYW